MQTLLMHQLFLQVCLLYKVFQMLCINEVCRYFKEKYNIGLCPRIIKKRIEEKGEEWQKENPYHNRFIFKCIDKANG